ncbi:MAG: NAD(P)H-hydrate dehydratase [Aquificaceae bacterium]
MKILKAHEMVSIDRRTVDEVGVPSILLMENAALRTLEVIKGRFKNAKKFLIVAGKGNNGGDGLAIARHLHLLGYKVDYVLALGDELRGDAMLNYKAIRNLGLYPKEGIPGDEYDLIIDALFGTGFKPPTLGESVRWIEFINSSLSPVLSVDVPSGLSADEGKAYEPSVKANVTVTFQFPKVCHVLYPAAKLCGEVYVVNIGIPESFAEGISRESVDRVKIPYREPDAHKGKMGHVLLVGSSKGKSGALIMAAKAATRTGSGLVSVGVPSELNHIFEIALTEEMSIPLEGTERLSYKAAEEIISMQERFHAVGIGMGMGRYQEGSILVKKLILKVRKPLLIDADGLNNLADLKDMSFLKDRESPVVLTPHVGEFERLSGWDKEAIVNNLMDAAVEFAQRWGCFLVLKSSRTVIATPNARAYLSMRGTSAMAKGGMGDVLSGILTSLLGRGMEIEEALKLGVFLHGLAGEIAEGERHKEGVKALDIVESIPKAYNHIENESYPPIIHYLS